MPRGKEKILTHSLDFEGKKKKKLSPSAPAKAQNEIVGTLSRLSLRRRTR